MCSFLTQDNFNLANIDGESAAAATAQLRAIAPPAPHCFISLNVFGRTPFLAFGRAYTFSKDPMQFYKWDPWSKHKTDRPTNKHQLEAAAVQGFAMHPREETAFGDIMGSTLQADIDCNRFSSMYYKQSLNLKLCKFV